MQTLYRGHDFHLEMYFIHLEWVLVRRQEALIVPPSLDEGKASRFARRVGQCVDDILDFTDK